MAFAVKIEVSDPQAPEFAFTAQKTMYGGKHIAAGDTVFIFASENEGGQGLIARGVVTSAEAIAKKAGIARQTPRVSIAVRRIALAKRPLGRRELKPFSDWNDGVSILRFGQHRWRETMRQVMLADHDLDIGAEVVFVTDNLHHSTARILSGRWPVGDLDIHDDIFQIVPIGAARSFLTQYAVRTLSAACGFAGRDVCVNIQRRFFRILHPRRNHNLLRDFLIDRSDIVPPAAVVKFPYDSRVCPSNQA